MPAGRPPKPTKLKILTGNPGKRPLNDREPMPAVEAPKMPAWLSRRAKDEWRRIVPILLNLGLLTRVDLAALVGYCQSFAEVEEATRILNREGRIIERDIYSRNGDWVGTAKELHPAVKLQHEASNRVKAFLTEFGLSPMTRTRVKTIGGEKPAADPAEQFLRGNQA